MNKIIKIIRDIFYRVPILFDTLKKITFLAPNFTQKATDYMNSIEIHCIEKGLGMPNVRLGFGSVHLKNIFSYIDKSKDKQSYNYLYSLSIIKEYIEFHKKNNYDVSWVEDKFKKYGLAENEEFYKAGVFNLEHLSNDKDFESVLLSRHSVRQFEDQFVSEEILREVFELNQSCPSACNRQTTKIYYSMDKTINDKIGELLPGNNGFRKHVNQYLVLTGDISAFRYDEYGQWFTNVGIYAYGLTLCLHYKNIDSCMLQWIRNKQGEKVLKNLLHISDTEEIVMAIAIGYRADNAKILISTRKPISDIVRKV